MGKLLNEQDRARAEESPWQSSGQSFADAELDRATASIHQRELSKVALAQIKTDPGKLAENISKILQTIEEAKERGAEIIVLPELCIPGYYHLDLAEDRRFLEQNMLALELIAKRVEGITVVAGFLDLQPDKQGPGGGPYVENSLALIRDGQIILKQGKANLPNYGPHSESRWTQANKRSQVVELGGEKVGLAICEDLWVEGYQRNPVAELAAQGAKKIFVSNASPYEVGKLRKRLEVLKERAQESSVTLIYSNLVGSFDGRGSEVVFDGRSMIVDPSGKVLHMAAAFEEELSVFDLKKQVEADTQSREEIAEIHDALLVGIKEYYRRNGFKKAYIGLSGGIDSAVVAALAVEALGAENVIGITMPSHITSDETKSDAYRLAGNLGIKIIESSIRDEYQAWLRNYRKDFGEEPDPIAKQNKQARIRGANLMARSNCDWGSLVLATSNKTEAALGYCTIYGDTNGAMAPIGDLNKLRVYALAEYINAAARSALIPKSTIHREPSAELEENQSDEANLPASYDILSPLVDDIVEGQRNLSELLDLYPEDAVLSSLKLIERAQFKHRLLPPMIRVSARSLGNDWKIPMGQSARRNSISDQSLHEAASA